MDINMFGSYAALFTALINGENEHPGLVGLSIDENIKVMDEQELNSALLKILTIHYRNKLQSIPRDTTIAPNQKPFLLKKIKLDILPRLKKGELVAFDSLN
jgi:DNA primase